MIIKQQEELAKVKKQGATPSKTAGMLKRIMVAWWLLSWFLIPIHMGQPWHCLNLIVINMLVYNECKKLLRDEKKHRNVSSGMEWLIFFSFLYLQMPRYMLNNTVMIKSGLPKAEYPLLHHVLFDWHMHIVLILGMIIIVWFISNL